MKKVKVILPIILPILLIMGILAVSVYADKPESPPGLSKPVSVSGAINGVGAPARIAISFDGQSFVNKEHNELYVANPDGGLRVFGTRKGPRMLRYRYCYASYHDEPDYCDNPEHDPTYYRSLRIYDGTLEGKGRNAQIVWPAGSTWEIYSKDPYGVLVDSSQLATKVIYKEEK